MSFFGMRGIEVPVEVLEGLHVVEAGGAGPRGEFALLADIELVLEGERQELGVGEPAGDGLLQAHAQGRGHAGKPELFEGRFE
jgi:hypothetical protein